MPNFIDEYLIRLGASLDSSGLSRFHQALREATQAVDATAIGMAKAITKAEIGIVGGFAAMGTAALGLVDKVAMADQAYRLFGLHMYMSLPVARSLKVAMDALGEPLENLTWDPELRGRTIQLLEDQRRMAPAGDFEAQMRKVRDIRFEFTRMEVELQYLTFNVIQNFLDALGVGPDTLLKKLRAFNDWVIVHMPQISAWIAQHFLPVWRDIEMVMRDTFRIAEDLGALFTSVVGILSGDPALVSATFSFDRLADAVARVVHWLAVAFDIASRFFGLISGVTVGGGVGGAIGSVIGFLTGGFAGVIPGGLVGNSIGSLVGGGTGAAFDLYRYLNNANTGNPVSLLPAASPVLASPTAQLMDALQGAESGGQGMAARSPKGAIGTYQLMPNTAAALGVNPYSAAGNAAGAHMLMAQLLNHYHGDVAEAVGAYNAGQPRMDAFLAGRATLPAETQGEIARVLRSMGQTGPVQVGSVTIYITDSGDPHRTAQAVKQVLADQAGKRVQRNLAEFQSQSYSY